MDLTGEADRMKAERSQFKCKVTTASKKLKYAIGRKSDESCIQNFVLDLENCMSDFEICHDEYAELIEANETLSAYAVVNGLDLVRYKAAVWASYQEAKDCYQKYKRDTIMQSSYIPLREQLCNHMKRMTIMCNSLDQALEGESPSPKNIRSGKDGIVPAINLLLDLQSKLNNIEANEDLNEKINALYIRAVDTESHCNLMIKQIDKAASVQNVKFLDYKSDVSLDTSKSANLTTTEIKPDLSARLAASLSVSDPGEVVNDVTGITTTAVQSGCISSASLTASSSTFCPSRSWVPSNTYGLLTNVPTSHAIPGYPGHSIASSMPIHAPVTSSGHIPDNIVPNSVYNTPSMSWVPSSTYGLSTNVPTGYPIPGYFGHSMASSLSNNTYVTASGHVPQVAQNIPSPAIQPSHGNLSYARNDVHLQKFKLPEFSGNRKDWPEFKVVWRELAERSYSSKSALAFELKRCVKGQAKEQIKHIYVTRPEAYDMIWERLSEFYDDISASVQAAMDGLQRLRPIKDDDYQGIVNLASEVEAVYAQLQELGHLDLMSLREIDRIAEMLPSGNRMLWMRTYQELSTGEKIRPLNAFMQFLKTERASVMRMVSQDKKRSHQAKVNTVLCETSSIDLESKYPKPPCAVHKNEKVKHNTAACKNFRELSLENRYEVLKSVHACFNCFGYHRRDKCKAKVVCEKCNKRGHHTLLCKRDQTIDGRKSSEISNKVVANASSNHVARSPSQLSLYAIMSAFIVNDGKQANIFCDNGSNTS
jgi:hypothetical protein